VTGPRYSLIWEKVDPDACANQSWMVLQLGMDECTKDYLCGRQIPSLQAILNGLDQRATIADWVHC
jgi:hypothetical protein